MGLSKPIIISTSAVDTSNLATKSDMTTLQNSVTSALANVGGGGVKSIQKVFLPKGTNVSDSDGGTLKARYKDYTISSVDTTKSYIIPNGGYGGYDVSVNPCCELVSATKVRVFTNAYNSNTFYACGGFTVIETN